MRSRVGRLLASFVIGVRARTHGNEISGLVTQNLSRFHSSFPQGTFNLGGSSLYATTTTAAGVGATFSLRKPTCYRK